MALAVIDLTGQTRLGNAGALAAAFDGVTSQVGGACANLSITSAQDMWVGTRLAAARRIGQIVLHGSSNFGFVTVNIPTVLTFYGKAGSDPATSVDGVVLATLSFTDTADESAGRTFAVTDTAFYDRVWVRLTHNSATARSCTIGELKLWESVAGTDLAAVEDAVSDVAALAGSASSIADLAATEAAVVDVAAFTAVAAAGAALAATEAVVSDTAQFTAVLTPLGSATADLVVTEAAVTDVAALTAVAPVGVALAAQEAAPTDTAQFTAVAAPVFSAASADLVVTEPTPPDSAAFAVVVTPVVVVPPPSEVTVSPSPPAVPWKAVPSAVFPFAAPSVPTAPKAPQIPQSSSAPAARSRVVLNSPAVPVPYWPSSSCCPEYFPPGARAPLLRSPSSTNPDPGGYDGGYDSGYDIAASPGQLPDTWRSAIPAMPPLPDPPLPGYCRAGDPCRPQRSDTEAYRRAVFRGEITPTGLAAVDGVAVNAAELRDLVQVENDATINTPSYVQIAPSSADYDHGAFSQGFG